GPGVIVLAAGRGTRMRSALPKVLHPVCGTPMVAHVLAAVQALAPARVVVVTGYEGERVREALDGQGAVFVDQPQLLGTGDAVERCRDALQGCERVVVVNGDAPLLRGETLTRLVDAAGDATMAIAVNRVLD